MLFSLLLLLKYGARNLLDNYLKKTNRYNLSTVFHKNISYASLNVSFNLLLIIDPCCSIKILTDSYCLKNDASMPVV